MITIISTSTAIQEVAAISMFSNFLLITKLLDNNNFVCLHMYIHTNQYSSRSKKLRNDHLVESYARGVTMIELSINHRIHAI